MRPHAHQEPCDRATSDNRLFNAARLQGVLPRDAWLAKSYFNDAAYGSYTHVHQGAETLRL